MRRQSAFTLIEIIVTIIVIGIAATALLSVFTSLVRGSADPVIQQQATTIAEAYLEEIVLRAFEDPQGGETGTDEGEAGRADYDDVQDYASLAAGPAADQFGNPIAALAAYTVSVSVSNQTLNGIGALDALRIDVLVSHPAADPILLSAYRTRY
ncbi:MAG: prepilin-type N-terminal cleavage/methylation domain-containing protein [Gammaproteobacteria bacterium]|nr:prepilin-type N-terminal cleavage/methylation domain-containing protein [Gammaproteobacteria bacterium]MDH3534646.1 prepilin-type N-terminal cleavage/methylation domain-containing protein [Gammaproteobacteria bacterium]